MWVYRYTVRETHQGEPGAGVPTAFCLCPSPAVWFLQEQHLGVGFKGSPAHPCFACQPLETWRGCSDKST